MNDVKLKWTQADKAKLKKLELKKAEFYMQNMTSVDKVADILGAAVHNDKVSNLAYMLVKHAGQIRDALEPFDSGERAAPSPDSS